MKLFRIFKCVDIDIGFYMNIRVDEGLRLFNRRWKERNKIWDLSTGLI